ACWTALDRQARGLKAAGDSRSLRHLMCDTLVERVTGLSRADQLPVRVDVAVNASTLTGADDHPAQLRGYGPIPAPTLKRLLAGPDVVLRRLVTDPVDDHVLSVDSKQRFFRGELRDLIFTIDPICVVPGCDRPAVQADHAAGYADGGPTTASNGLGACTRHNLAHEQPGHRLEMASDEDRNEILWRTLSRKVYKLLHPPALGPGAQRGPDPQPPQPPRRQ
ncbi:MAG: HNH endonuclease signature motif containing protein, partial [Nocardioidaceae bacterium]